MTETDFRRQWEQLRARADRLEAEVRESKDPDLATRLHELWKEATEVANAFVRFQQGQR